MCGRYVLAEPNRLKTRFNVKSDPPIFKASYNISPSQNVPVVTKNSPNIIRLMKWGFIPHWADPKNTKLAPFNARDDSLVKPFFRDAYKNNRCLIPATGWYEWKELDLEGKPEKWPFYFTLEGRDVFGFGGIYSEKKDSGGKSHYTFAIITTRPNKKAQEIHNRMPLVIDKINEESWLNSKTEIDKIDEMITPFDNKSTVYWKVRKEVGNPANNNAGLLEKI